MAEDSVQWERGNGHSDSVKDGEIFVQLARLSALRLMEFVSEWEFPINCLTNWLILIKLYVKLT
jgi:hypothetical protein